MDTKYASRKFLLTLLIVGIAVGMNWLGRLSPELVEILKWSLGLYCGFNVTQQAAQWIAQKV